jgi:predicted nucleic acid-binding protein
LWKKARRGELSREEALLAARLLQGAEIELLPTLPLLDAAAAIAIELDHPAYDCLYLALASAKDCRFITADDRLLSKLSQGRQNRFRNRTVSLAEATA